MQLQNSIERSTAVCKRGLYYWPKEGTSITTITRRHYQIRWGNRECITLEKCCRFFILIGLEVETKLAIGKALTIIYEITKNDSSCLLKHLKRGVVRRMLSMSWTTRTNKSILGTSIFLLKILIRQGKNTEPRIKIFS